MKELDDKDEFGYFYQCHRCGWVGTHIECRMDNLYDDDDERNDLKILGCKMCGKHLGYINI